MQLPSTTVALATAVGLVQPSLAFLITPDIADVASKAKESFGSLVLERSHTLDVACPGCPFFVEEERSVEGNGLSRVALNDVANSIHLEITANEIGVQINNATIYPFTAIGPPVFAHQTRLDDNMHGIDVPLDFAASVRAPIVDEVPSSNDEPIDHMFGLIPIDFAVIAISGIAVSAQSAHIDLMHNRADNTYEIVRVVEGNFVPQMRVDPCAGQPTYSACRLRHTVEEQLKDMLDAAKGRAHGVKAWLKTDPLRSMGRPCHGKHGMGKEVSGGPIHHIKGGRKHHDHPEHHGGHHGHHRSRAIRVLRAIHHAIHFVIIPALLGVAGGLAASALGMLVGQTVAYCWMRFGRGGRRGTVVEASVYEVEVVPGEKEGLIVLGEEPPRYQDVDVEAEADIKAST